MDPLLDTSWTLHYLSTSSASYRNLFSHATVQDHLSRYFDRLPQFLSAQKPRYVDDLNNDSEKLGPLRDCQPSIHQPTGGRRLIQLRLNYQHTTFTFILYSPYVILSKAPVSHTKHITNFLSETFTVSIDPLKLPSSLLANSLQDYISTLVSIFTDDDDDDDNDDNHNHLRVERRAALLRSAIGTLRITISFSGPVAPHLRTMDISVPSDTVNILHAKATAVDNNDEKPFLQSLSDHIHLQTGLKLPLTGGEDDDRHDEPASAAMANSLADPPSSSSSPPPSNDGSAPLKLSKLTTAAFALSTDGRIRFAGKAIEHATLLGRDAELTVVEANVGLLARVVEQVKKMTKK